MKTRQHKVLDHLSRSCNRSRVGTVDDSVEIPSGDHRTLERQMEQSR